MQQRSILWQAAGFAAVTFGGTILHFLYDWTGGSILVASFSGVNESTWEHMKLLFWPLFLFALVQWLFFKDQDNYWCVKLAEILLGLVLIPMLFYTYNGAFGKSPDWINIAIFYITALLVFLFEERPAAMQTPAACLRRNLSDWCAVRGVYLRTASASTIPRSTHGNLWNLTSKNFLRKDLQYPHFQ